MGNKKPLSIQSLKILWGKSGNCCAICRGSLVSLSKGGKINFVVGEEAHIQGENLTSARYNPNMTNEDRNAYANRILLCPTDHTKIDKNESDYSVDELNRIKQEHEKWVSGNLKMAIPNITFAELEVVLEFISSADVSTIEDLSLIHPEEKVKKNKLSSDVDRLIRMGISQCGLVRDYLNKNIDIKFSERIKSKFVEKYEALKSEGFNADSIFYELLDFASNGNTNLKSQTAALCVVAYFFEQCDIFEK